ncbi:MAG: nickel pincer cofactor biosynthesis protein LarB [Candidatus Heimdallarchaeota archaeon]|nr:MAG: nickel pincer cofactor biosynthesis protein LarB [Candidatus Gerdarchaeota archaeon]RLI70418.1 MAG: nickel pincer cofactor biosynthesis protein LarB [Candidatus Gerdarchaeota archaeon]
MDEHYLKELLLRFKEGRLTLEKVLQQLKDLPFEDLGYAKIDHHRALRKGFPEVVYCPGKTIEQIKTIFSSLNEKNKNILLTRASKSIYTELKKIDPQLQFNAQAKIIYIEKKPRIKVGKVLIICGGTADIPIAEEAALTAELMGANVERIFDVGVAGIHRLLNYKEQIFEANVIVAIAGMEGALASVIAGLAACPIIAIPTSVGYGANFHGISALLTMLNSCAPNVAVVNIDNGFGGGLMAALINKQREQLIEKQKKE